MSAPMILFVVLCLGTGVMRLGELVVSRRRMAEKPDAVVEEPWLFPLMALLHAGLVFLPLAEVWFLSRPWIPALGGAALGVLVLATVLRVWTLSTLGRSWNVQVVVPDAPVTAGPYAFIRHPNYLVVCLEIAALPLVHTAWMSALFLTALNAFVLFHRIRTEEASLMQVEGWRNAMADKARLIPGLL